MSTYVALLRGVNVGKARRVPMADFRALLTELGYTNVVTLLNSGNAVFQSSSKVKPDRLAAEIANAIARKLKVEVPVIVKSAQELAMISAENALATTASDPSRLLVAFVQDTKALPGLAVIESLVMPPEEFLLGKTAAYLHCTNGILQSRAGEALLGKVGKAATTRNWATVLKLQALVSNTDV